MPERTHYEVLGLPETASLEEIKKQYRALARTHHPDVNSGPHAALQFSAIAEAYRVLNDSESRRVYDAERTLRQRQTNFKSAGAVNHPAGPRPASSPSPQQSATTATQESDRLLQQAQIAFSRNRMAEARTLAEQALHYNKKNAAAWEVMGDVSRNQERNTDALRHYTMASQHDPRRASVQQKIERIARQPVGPQSSAGGYTPNTPIRQRPPQYAARPRAPLTANMPPDKRSLTLVLVGFFGYFGTFLILIFAGLTLDKSSASTHVLPIVTSWSWPYVSCMALAGALLGATMTITGAIRRIEDDLILSGTTGPHAPPFGILVVVVGLLFFWVAALMHLGVSLFQEALTASRLRLYGAVALLTCFFAISWTAPWGTSQTLLWGGNVIFISFVIGWLLGDFFRQD